MSDLETKIEGSPGSIRAVGSWLRQDFGEGVDELATTVYQQRSRAASDWQGAAGTAFGERSQSLATAADTAHDTAGETATILDVLAQALQRAQEDMAEVRTEASGAGLTVSGTIVHKPGPAPAAAGPAPGAGASAQETRDWQAADDAVRDHNVLVEAWNRAVERANEIFATWQEELTGSASTWATKDDKLVGLSADFLTAAAEIALISKAVPVLMAQSEAYAADATRLRGHADAMRIPDGRVVDRDHFYRLLDEADRLDDSAAATRQRATAFELPKGVGRALGVLGIAATGYGIHADMEDGESAAQATVSNVAGMGASIAAGAYIGGAIGTAIPVPILGTVTGVVVGAVVGTAVGAFTSGVIDSVWENGMDSLGDAGDAVMDGLGEIGETASAIGGLAEDAWDAIF